MEEAINFSEAIFICVGTPTTPEGEADLSQVEDVVSSISKYMDDYKLIIEKSTVPVNTHLKIREMVREKTDIDFDVASNPEFLAEGTSVYNFMNPHRIVVGVDTPRARKIFEEIYQPFTTTGFPLLITDIPSAEIIKYASNAFLAMKISYINMISDLCEKQGPASTTFPRAWAGPQDREQILKCWTGIRWILPAQRCNCTDPHLQGTDLDTGLLQKQRDKPET